jgi:hypothetical protein
MRHTLRLIRDGLLLGPPGRRHPPTQIHESFLGNVDAEGADGVSWADMSILLVDKR